MVEREYQRIKEIIRNNFHLKKLSLDKIILFGSYSKGEETSESDIDLLILSKDFRKKTIFEKDEIMGDLDWELVSNTKKPFDILYYSDEEWENDQSLIIREAKKHGKVIYG